MRRAVGAFVLALSLGCHREPTPLPPREPVLVQPAAPRAESRRTRRSEAPAPHPMPEAPPLPPPSPEAVALGFDLVPIDDAFGEADVAWLILTLRNPPPAPVRELHHLGALRGCAETEALVLRDHGANTARRALISVRCEGPPRADYSVMYRPDGSPELVRSGCTEGNGPCSRDTLPDEVIARVGLPQGMPPLGPSSLARREVPPPLPPREAGVAPVPRGAVSARWYEGPTVDALVPGRAGARTLTLVIDGVVQRRLDTPPLGSCTAPTGGQRAPAGALAPSGATMVRRCETPEGAVRWLSVEHRDDMLRLHVTAVDARGAIAEPRVIAQRVALPRGTRVVMGD